MENPVQKAEPLRCLALRIGMHTILLCINVKKGKGLFLFFLLQQLTWISLALYPSVSESVVQQLLTYPQYSSRPDRRI